MPLASSEFHLASMRGILKPNCHFPQNNTYCLLDNDYSGICCSFHPHDQSPARRESTNHRNIAPGFVHAFRGGQTWFFRALPCSTCKSFPSSEHINGECQSSRTARTFHCCHNWQEFTNTLQMRIKPETHLAAQAARIETHQPPVAFRDLEQNRRKGAREKHRQAQAR